MKEITGLCCIVAALVLGAFSVMTLISSLSHQKPTNRQIMIRKEAAERLSTPCLPYTIVYFGKDYILCERPITNEENSPDNSTDRSTNPASNEMGILGRTPKKTAQFRKDI